MSSEDLKCGHGARRVVRKKGWAPVVATPLSHRIRGRGTQGLAGPEAQGQVLL